MYPNLLYTVCQLSIVLCSIYLSINNIDGKWWAKNFEHTLVRRDFCCCPAYLHLWVAVETDVISLVTHHDTPCAGPLRAKATIVQYSSAQSRKIRARHRAGGPCRGPYTGLQTLDSCTVAWWHINGDIKWVMQSGSYVFFNAWTPDLYNYLVYCSQLFLLSCINDSKVFPTDHVTRPNNTWMSVWWPTDQWGEREQCRLCRTHCHSGVPLDRMHSPSV